MRATMAFNELATFAKQSILDERSEYATNTYEQ